MSLISQSEFSWACEPKRKRFSHPYGCTEALAWAWNRAFGPSRSNKGSVAFLPQHHQLNEIEPRITVAFAGDVMPAGQRRYSAAESVKGFIRDADFLVLNLEGVISEDDYASNSVRHSSGITSFLKDLFPSERTVLTMANNHSADCGWREFDRCFEQLRGEGFLVCGRRDEPAVMLTEDVLVANYTAWLNHPGDFVARLANRDGFSVGEASFRVLSPHWGYEMQLYPAPKQVAAAKQLAREWDLIVGHHSHCPQPVAAHDDRLVAYSAGSFCRGTKGPRFHWGLLLKAEVGPAADGAWKAGSVEWRFVHQRPVAGDAYEVYSTSCCPFFGGVA